MKQHDLRSGDSFWKASGPEPVACPAFEGDAKCDVAIVGAGITGTLIGYFLARAGMDVILCDKGDVGAGSTAASTGMLQYEIDEPLINLIVAVGEAHAVYAYRRGHQAIDELESLMAEVDPGNQCGFSRRSTLCLASAEEDLPQLRREHECRLHFGFDVRFLERAALKEFCGISEAGALLSAGDGQVDPYRLTQLLLLAARTQGLRAYSETEIVNVETRSGGAQLRTRSGSIDADAVVFATGYFPNPYSPPRLATLQTTYATVSEPCAAISGWPGEFLIWETARPYFYARQTVDGRVMIGGGDTPFADDHQDSDLLAAKTERLRLRFEQMFPGTVFEPACVWAGTFAETGDGLPFIGRPSENQHVYLALGYGGNGITFGAIAARLVTDLIMRRKTDDAAVFRFGR